MIGRIAGSRRHLPFLAAVLSLTVIAAVYIRSADNYFQSDDFDWLEAYGLQAAAKGTVQAVFALPEPEAVDPADPFTWNYRPTTAFLVNVLFRVFGADTPAGYHAVLIAGHLVASALVGLLAYRLTRNRWTGAAVVAVFGLHFAHVETVAWFGSIAEVVAGVLGLAAVLAFLHYRESGRPRWAWTAVVIYGLALGANPTAAPIIGVFVLVDLWRFARGTERRCRAFWIYLPLLALASAYLAIEVAALSVAAGSGGYGYSLGLHVLLNALWYPAVLVAPFTEPDLFDVHRALLSALDGTGTFPELVASGRFAPVLVAHVAIMGAVSWISIRGPGWARVAAGSALCLEAPFVLLGGTMFHFTYLPAAFVLTIGVAAVVGVARAVTVPPTWFRAVTAGTLVVAAGLLASQTHGRLDDWEFAAGLSHRLVQSAHAELGDLPTGSTVIAGGLPNTVNGAFVFREGFPAALRVTYGRSDFEVQTFSKSVVLRLLSESQPSEGRYFLIYEPSAMTLRLETHR